MVETMEAGHKRPSKEETLRRRNIIKDIFFKDNITTAVKIQDILKNKHNIVVDRQTVYKDIKTLGSVGEGELKVFESDILSTLKRNIRELQRMIDEELDVIRKANLMKIMSQLCKDEHSLAASIALVGRDLRMRERGSENTASGFIVFGEPEIADNVKTEEKKQYLIHNEENEDTSNGDEGE